MTHYPYQNNSRQRERQIKSCTNNKRRKAVCFSTQPDNIFHYRDSPRTRDDMNSNNKPRKVVCFSTQDDIFHYSSPTNEEINSTWYSSNDMLRMKKEAKNLAHRLHAILASSDKICETAETKIMKLKQRQPLLRIKPNRIVNDKSTSLIKGSVDECRGLEFHIFTERQMKNQIAIRTIMRYQRMFKARIAIAKKTGDPNLKKLVEEVAPEALRIISSKCTRWARNVAFETGKVDFEEAYGSGRGETVQACFPFAPSKSLSERLENEGRFPLKKRKFLNETALSLMNQKKKRVCESMDHRDSLFIPNQIVLR